MCAMMIVWMVMAMATVVIIAYIPKKAAFFGCFLCVFFSCAAFQLFAYVAPSLPSTHMLPTYCSREPPRFAHQVGLASNPHDPRSPPTCQMTHVTSLKP